VWVVIVHSAALEPRDDAGEGDLVEVATELEHVAQAHSTVTGSPRRGLTTLTGSRAILDVDGASFSSSFLRHRLRRCGTSPRSRANCSTECPVFFDAATTARAPTSVQ
jgi:hypothetical protein